MALPLLLTLLALPAEPAPLRASPPQVASADEPELARPRKRLLHLAGGGVVRGKARLQDGRWLVEAGRSDREIPAAAVVRVVAESEALAEARKRSAGLGREDGDGRVEHARWLGQQGLHEECLETLDGVLQRDPDQAAALAYLGERPLALALPGRDAAPGSPERAALWEHASRLPRAARELALLAATDVPDRPALRAELDRELVDRSSARRELAALALRRRFPGEAALPLAARAALDPSEAVRLEAGRALRDARNPEVAGPLIRALESSHSVVRRNAAEALGTMGYAAAVEPLVHALAKTSGYRPAASNIFVGRQIAYVGDFDVEVAQNESIADPQINVLIEGSVLDARVLSTTAESTIAAERSAVRGALESLTGAKVAKTRNAWQRWWEESGEEFLRERGLLARASAE